MNLEKREMELRLQEDERTVAGIAVPYGQVTKVGSYQERFERGAVEDITDTKLFYAHSEPIGKVTNSEEREEGLYIEATISDTPRGNEIRTLLKDNVLNKFSVGFLPVESENVEGITVRQKVDLKEVSIVPFPSYSDANVLTVREDENILNEGGIDMSNEENNSSQELVELRDSMESLERKVDTLYVPAESAPSEPLFRSYGHYIKARVAGEDKAIELENRYKVDDGSADGVDGGVVADAISQNAWIGSVVDIFSKQRKVLNAFDTAALPGSGVFVEYAKLKSNTVDYDTQALEGDKLVYGKVQLETATAPVITAGGFTTLSRQEIERTNQVNILSAHFDAMNAAYADYTNDYVRAQVVAAKGTQEITGPDLTDSGEIIGAVVDAAQLLDDVNSSIDSILVSPDVFKGLATLVDTANRPVLEFRQPSVNTLGTASATNLSATLLGVPVIVDPGAAVNTLWVFNSDAVLTLESPGVPFRLSQEDVTVLTQTFSTYGYIASAVQRPDHIVKATFA